MLIKGENGKFKHVPETGGERISPKSTISPSVVIPLPCDIDGTAEMTWGGQLLVDGEMIDAGASMVGKDLLVVTIRIKPSDTQSEYVMRMAKVKPDDGIDDPLPTRPLETKETES